MAYNKEYLLASPILELLRPPFCGTKILEPRGNEEPRIFPKLGPFVQYPLQIFMGIETNNEETF